MEPKNTAKEQKATANRSSSWDSTFDVFRNFLNEYGCMPNEKTVYQGVRLGVWCKNQKYNYKKGCLSSQHIQMLADAGFEFETSQKSWLTWYELYCEYKHEFGREPSQKTVYRNARIGVWCDAQKSRQKNGTLPKERFQMLTDAGFSFCRRNEKWKQMFELYCDYKCEHGQEPTNKTTHKGQNLGGWCAYQRILYRQEKLSPEYIQQLSHAGFAFGESYEEVWQKWIALYIDYKKEYAHEPTISTVYRGQALGTWCATQRRRYKKGELDADRVQQLNNIHFPWKIRKYATWDKWLLLYQQYKKEYKVEPSAKIIYQGRCLGQWCCARKREYQQGELSEDQIKQLIDSGFMLQLTHLDAKWSCMVDLYCAYKNECGNEPPPTCLYRGEALGAWCTDQRRYYKSGQLSPERIQRLNDANFTWDYRKALWHEWHRLCNEYMGTHQCEPSRSVIYRNKRLGLWLYHQKVAYQDGSLAPERIQLLHDIGVSLDKTAGEEGRS